MEKKKQWQKPELGVLARSKPEETAKSSRRGRSQHYLALGPLKPAPPAR